MIENMDEATLLLNIRPMSPLAAAFMMEHMNAIKAANNAAYVIRDLGTVFLKRQKHIPIIKRE